jgi:hypothetical protein
LEGHIHIVHQRIYYLFPHEWVEKSSDQIVKTTFFIDNFKGPKKYIFTLCGVSKSDLEIEDTRIESRNLNPEQEAQELARFLKEDGKWTR